MRIRLCALVLGLVLVACSGSARDVDYGPFLADDPFGVVADVEWREMGGALPSGPIPGGGPIAVLLEDSTDEVLHIAVNGGACRPELRIAVVQPPPELELGISVGEGIPSPGEQCGEVLTTHGFELRLTEPAALDSVVLNPMLSDGDNDVPMVVPGTDGSLPGDVWVGCPHGPYFPASALDHVETDVETDPPGLPEAMGEFLSDEEGRYWPQEGWRILHRTDSAVLLVHHDAVSGGISFLEYEFEDGAWRWDGASSGGPCPLQIRMPDGLGVVTWRLDPEAGPLTPDMTSVLVLATELDCASGQAMGDRLVGPEVLMTEQEVLIAFGVKPLSGARNCIDNPEQAVTVQLPVPLGDREVRDGMDTGLDLADFLG